MVKKRKDVGPGQGARGPARKKKAKAAPLPEAPDDSDVEVSDDDVDFVDEYTQRLEFLTFLNREQIDRHAEKGVDKKKQPKLPAPVVTDKADNEHSEQDEESYEQKPRQKAAETIKERERADLLPVKVNGELLYRRDAKTHDQDLPTVPAVEGITIQEDGPKEGVSPVVTDDDDDGEEGMVESNPASLDHGEEGDVARERTASGASAEISGRDLHPGPAAERLHRGTTRQAELQEFQQEQERREDLKQQIALAATKLLQDPEQHLRELQPLLQLVSSRDEVVARLAMLSLAAVFKDILPGYKIRTPTEKELSMAVSKEVKKLRDHETGLLRAYQGYLKGLLAACNKTEATGDPNSPVSGIKPSATARVGVKCLAILLKSLAHFNHAFDILQAVVLRMVHRDEVIASEACGAVRTLLAADAVGDGSLARDAVQLVADLVKRRKCVAPPQTVEVLLGLALRSAKASDVKSGVQREYRSRKTRKKEKRLRRGEDEVSAAFRESQATVDAAQKRRVQSETLEALFEIFFRALKQCTASSYAAADRKGPPMTEAQAAKKFPLLAPALQGLTRYAHLISVEYFSDLLTVMQQIGNAPGLPLRTRLQCILTASDILKGQGEALTVDRHHLYQALYLILGHSCLGSLKPAASPIRTQHQQAGTGGRGGHASSSQQHASGAKQGAGHVVQAVPFPVLLSRTAHQMLVEQARALDSGRMAAFALRLAGAARFLGPGGALGLLAVLERLLRQQPRLRGMLDMDTESPVHPVIASKDPHSLEDAARTALGSQLWQLHASASSHGEEIVRRAAKAVAAIPTDNMSGHHVPMFAVADGPPGVAAGHLNSLERGLEGAHIGDPERGVMLDKLQGLLDAYFLKARGSSESQRERDACGVLSAEVTALLTQLQGARAGHVPVAGAKQGIPFHKKKSSGPMMKGKQIAKKAQKHKPHMQKQG